MALSLDRRLNHRCASFAKHLNRGFRNDLSAEIVLVFQLIQNELEMSVTCNAELIDALDRLSQHSPIKTFRIVRFRWMGFLEANVEDHSAVTLNAIHQAEGGIAQFSVL